MRLDVNLKDYKGATPLHRAKNEEVLEVIRYFVKDSLSIFCFDNRITDSVQLIKDVTFFQVDTFEFRIYRTKKYLSCVRHEFVHDILYRDNIL